MTNLGWVVAPYAALVGTIGLVWQIITRVRSNWTRVALRAEMTGVPEDPDDEDPDYWPALVVTVLNKSEFPVRVMNAFVGPAKGAGSLAPELATKDLARFTERLPARVPVHDALDLFFDWNKLAQLLGDDRRVRVSVRLSTGWRVTVRRIK